VVWHVAQFAAANGVLPVRQVAAGNSAGRRRDIRQSIVAADVTQGARSRNVQPRQRESRGAVIEYAGGPSRDGVASRTLRRRRGETSRHVIRHVAANGLRAQERSRVAGVAIARAERVVVAYVTRRTGRRRRRHVCSS
jgi:hypothetical protein